MAKIDLNNLARPKQINSPDTKINQEVLDKVYIYRDLHLDLQQEKSIGYGTNSVKAKDILIDDDILAIKNSLRNIFMTKKGEKLLSPEFGCAFEQYLFEPVNETIANIMGRDILETIQNLEDRIIIDKIKIEPFPDENLYKIQIIYSFIEIKKQSLLNIIALKGGEILI
jgi:phage baseplate assembly protein W